MLDFLYFHCSPGDGNLKKKNKFKNLAEFLYIVCCLATVFTLLLVFSFSFFVSQIFCLCLSWPFFPSRGLSQLIKLHQRRY